MDIKIKDEEVFKPVTVEIKIETKKELDELIKSLSNYSQNRGYIFKLYEFFKYKVRKDKDD